METGRTGASHQAVLGSATPGACSFAVVSCLFDFLVLLLATELLYLRVIRMDPGFVQSSTESGSLPLPRQRATVSKGGRPASWIMPARTDVENSDAKLEQDSVDNGQSSSSLTESPSSELILPVIACEICDIRLPLRARHCYDCGRCVSRFDHHCPWLGQCVGRRNHRAFWIFLFVQSLLLVVCLKSLWFSLPHRPAYQTLREWVLDHRLFAVASMICAVALFCAVSMCWFHTWQFMTDITTFEFLMFRRLIYWKGFVIKSPFDRGVVENTRRFFLPPTNDCAVLDEEDTKQWWRAYERMQQRRRERETRQKQLEQKVV